MAKLNSTTNVMDKDTLPKSGLVRVAPCESTVLPGGVAMFAGDQAFTFYLKKNLESMDDPCKNSRGIIRTIPIIS